MGKAGAETKMTGSLAGKHRFIFSGTHPDTCSPVSRVNIRRPKKFMNFVMDRDARKAREEVAVVAQSENSGVEGKKKIKTRRGKFLLHHWRGIHIKHRSRFFSFSPTCKKKNKSFSQHFGPAGLSFTARPNSCERDTLLYLPQSMPSICFDISLSTGGNVE